jgi:hypothetical protein
VVSILCLIHPIETNASFTNGYPSTGIEITPDGPTQMQSIKVEVKGQDTARPKIIWVQGDTDIWTASFDNGTRIETGTHGNGANAMPLKRQTNFDLNMTNYAPDSMKDGINNSFLKGYVKDLEIEDMVWIREASYEPIGSKPIFQPGSTTATIKVSTGYPLDYSNKYKYATRADGADKFMAEYYIPMLVNYKGYVVEKKRMRVLENATMAVGQSKEMMAQVSTQEYNMTNWVDNWYEVTLAPETAWSSDNNAVATVDSRGKVTAKSTGTAKITAQWKKGPYWLYGTATINVVSGGNPGNPGDPGEEPGNPSGGCTSPAPSGNVIDVPLNDPAVSAVIKADSRGAERFNVLDGIPTTESLYGNVLAKSYLSKNKFVEMSGTCSFEVTVNRTYELTWDPGKEVTDENGNKHTEPDPQSASETVTKSYPIERKYSFWVIDNLEVYKINEAALQNYAFEGNGIRLSPSGYSPPSYAASKSSGYTPPSPPSTVEAPSGSKSGGKTKPDVSGENLKSYAEDAVDEVKVKNDSLTFNGSTIMNGAQTERAGQRPGQIPMAAPISNTVLYSPGQVIPTSKTNKADQPSTGTIYYGLMSGNINGGSDKSFPIYGINSVTVHTPVVMYPGVSDDRAHNQKTTPAAGRSAIILDRPFTVMMPNNGQHTNYLGYGNRDYLKYIGSKQVRFPFDVYEGTKAAFYPKNTWIEVDKSREQFAFFLPVWVDEGFYTVEFRTIAHNAPSGATEQTNANLNLIHHIAYGTVPVDVIGRVYDFQVTDIADYPWERVFRTAVGSRTPTGAAYWVGLNEIDGAPRGNISRFTLPIRPGSHPLYKNAVIKTGYHFKFDLKTKGNMFGPFDQIVITPSFDFIDATSGSRQPVDLYYHTGSRSYVRIGSASDQVQRYVILTERLRNVPIEELTDTALYQYDHDYNFNQVAGIGRSQFVDWFIQKHSQQKTPVGSFSQLRLPEGVRTLIGPKTGIPSGVDPARPNAAVQRWYGEYSLPAELYAVPAGTNVAEYGRTHGGLTDRSAIFLKKGYIVVNFNIETVRNGETGKPHLQYIRAPLMNQWTGMEGFTRSVIDPYGRRFTLKDGDVAFYHADLSSRDDFRPLVTH